MDSRTKSWVAGTFLALLVPFAVWGGELVLPHLFQGGQPIRASEFNANFEALRAKINEQELRLDALQQFPSGGMGSGGDVRVVSVTTSDFVGIDYGNTRFSEAGTNPKITQIRTALDDRTYLGARCHNSYYVTVDGANGTSSSGYRDPQPNLQAGKWTFNLAVNGSYPNGGGQNFIVTNADITCRFMIASRLSDGGIP